MSGWAVEYRRGSAGDLHEASAGALAGLAAGPGRQVRVLEATAQAIVLGSSQAATDIDEGAAGRAGVAVARRRSGGGAVLVGPGECLWIDLLLPVGDPLWSHDVATAGGLPAASTWRSPMRRSRWSDLVCFAGVGAGEVTVDGPDGPVKVVGVSQRRTRHGALFQTATLLRWDPDAVVGLLALDAGSALAATRDLRGVAVGIGSERRSPLLEALLDALSATG